MSKKRRGQGQATVKALRRKAKEAPAAPTDKERRRENWQRKKTG
ncbi:MAG: hypothetical protein NTY36_01915 [Deltaproteobacteria bacterium]|nr:hypothetical protein [Deltaproteobacteria bacterium]